MSATTQPVRRRRPRRRTPLPAGRRKSAPVPAPHEKLHAFAPLVSRTLRMLERVGGHVTRDRQRRVMGEDTFAAGGCDPALAPRGAPGRGVSIKLLVIEA